MKELLNFIENSFFAKFYCFNKQEQDKSEIKVSIEGIETNSDNGDNNLR